MHIEALPRVLSKKRLNRQNQALPGFIMKEQRFTLKFANTEQELDELLRLRFNVFNLEMGEGLASSFQTFRDEDAFDKFFNHLIIIDNNTDKIIGTYRMQTYEMALRGNGFYSHDEFKIEMLPRNIIKHSVELGRACIDKNYRNSRVLFLLWRGLTNYMILTRKRYMFGCCSLTSQNPAEGMALYDDLLKNGHIRTDLKLTAQPFYRLEGFNKTKDITNKPAYPPLLRMYLRYGAKIIGVPAIDREFKTIDFFILLDIETIAKETFSMISGNSASYTPHRLKLIR